MDGRTRCASAWPSRSLGTVGCTLCRWLGWWWFLASCRASRVGRLGRVRVGEKYDEEQHRAESNLLFDVTCSRLGCPHLGAVRRRYIARFYVVGRRKRVETRKARCSQSVSTPPGPSGLARPRQPAAASVSGWWLRRAIMANIRLARCIAMHAATSVSVSVSMSVVEDIVSARADRTGSKTTSRVCRRAI